MKPLAIDLYCGLGGWAEGFLAEGYDVVGFDIERHDYGTGGYSGQLVLQDVLTLHGSQFKGAAVIVASPPCQFYSYTAMPWKKAKQLAKDYRSNMELYESANRLFNACFRIQREACEAAGRHIPLIVENVRGAEPWVGRARWHFGSYYLWGDIPALMPAPRSSRLKFGKVCLSPREWELHSTRQKTTRHPNKRNGHDHTRHLTNPAEHIKNGGDWFSTGRNCSLQRQASSNSPKRVAAAAIIAKIPFPLAQWIAKAFKP